MAGGKRRGRPRKVPLTEEVSSDTQRVVEEVSIEEAPEPEVVRPPAPAGLQFTGETRQQIRLSEECYIVTKVRLEDGSKDKRIHDAMWLKDLV